VRKNDELSEYEFGFAMAEPPYLPQPSSKMGFKPTNANAGGEYKSTRFR